MKAINFSDWPQPVPIEEVNNIEDDNNGVIENVLVNSDGNTGIIPSEEEMTDISRIMEENISEDRQLLESDVDMLENSLQGFTSCSNESEGDIEDNHNINNSSDLDGFFIYIQ